MKNSASLLRKLEDAASRLNAESDSLNRSISAIEQQLVDANIGIEVWLQREIAASDRTETGYRETTHTVERLGFAKIDGKWCIAVKPMRIVNGLFEGDESSPFTNPFSAGEPVRLLAATRELRIAAIDRFPDLIELLTEEAERCRQAIGEVSRGLSLA